MASGTADQYSPDKALEKEPLSGDSEQKQLSDEDMARVQEYLSTSINSVDRKPFRPILLVIMLLVVMSSLSLLSILLARLNGIY